MTLCECGCKQELTGKQKRFVNDKHRAKFWTEARRKGAAKGKAHTRAIIGNKYLYPLLMAMIARKKMTSLELQRINNSMAIATDMSNIRRHYPQVSKAKYLRTENGRRIFEYEWLS